MDLAREIQEDAITDANSVAVLLRKLRVLASRINRPDLIVWVDSELNGYRNHEDLPSYRLLKGIESYGHFAGGYGSRLENGRIPPSALPENLRDRLTMLYMSEGVAEYQQLLSKAENELRVDWPADIVASVGRSIYDDMACLGAWRIVPASAVVRILESVRNRVLEIATDLQSASDTTGAGLPTVNETPYVNEARLLELRSVRSTQYDLARLIRLCEELNLAWRVGLFHAAAMLLRAVMDHVAPVFGVNSFHQIVNNYSGPRSFREAMAGLETSARKISDAHLHTHLRSREVLPNGTQVNFSPALDLLLSEIVRLLK